MDNNILTPITLWKDFDLSLPLEREVIGKKTANSINIEKIKFKGREVNGKRVQIFGYAFYPSSAEKLPAILYVNDTEPEINLQTCAYVAKYGYFVLAVDYYGESENENHTVYPEEISYANYKNCGETFFNVVTSAKETCWYEWVGVLKYATKFLKEDERINHKKMGVLGNRYGGELAWMLAGGENDFACFASVCACGWKSYKAHFRFDKDNDDIEMDDNRHKYIMGLEAHSYAKYVEKPFLMLSSTNDVLFDADRVNDTMLRINEEVPTYMNYAIMFQNYLGTNSMLDLRLFFAKYLQGESVKLTESAEIELYEENGKLLASVTKKGKFSDESVSLYYSEGIINPAKRSWTTAPMVFDGKGEKRFEIKVFEKNTFVTAFARIINADGFSVSTRIAIKDLNGVTLSNYLMPTKVIYDNSYIGNGEFIQLFPQTEMFGGTLSDIESAKLVKKGGMGIFGITTKFGLGTFKIIKERYKPEENNELRFDVCAKENAILKVSVIKNYLSRQETKFQAIVKVKGGESWNSVVLSGNDFKSDKGLSMENFVDAQLITFTSNEIECQLNNMIWI